MTTGVLVMAYGTPAAPEDLEAYYTHIRRGRAPTPELLAELRGRYEAIGGLSPLMAITRAQTDAVARALADRGHRDLAVTLGMKHAPPFIEDGVAELAEGGAQRIVGVVLAPHYSAFSVGEYGARAQGAAERAATAPRVDIVRSWHREADYLDYLERAVADALASIPAGDAASCHVLFTAHSLPERILGAGDPYPDELRETAGAIAARLDLAHWSVAWQSAGRTSEKWIGPDVLDRMRELAAEGTRAIVVCAAGFVSDHLEVLYDLDIEAAAEAKALGIAFARTAMPNADPLLAGAVASAVDARLGAVAGG
ncbi:MAG TPA: ferrochelatase [Solirubrobacteraceae bacterium]|nr:ferrochelatase [Solirubrobacteraceae bacterium]